MFDFIIGILGMVCILVAFMLEEFYIKWDKDTVKYNLTNIIGSALLTYYAYTLVSWPFIALNFVWFVTASLKLIGILKK